MDESLTQQRRVRDEGPLGRKPLLKGKNLRLGRIDGTLKVSLG